jgi:hypothetical protein
MSYREAYERCRMKGDALPRARAIQGVGDRVEASVDVERETLQRAS